MNTVIAIRSGISRVSGLRKPANLFSGEEIDRLDEGMLSGLGREELQTLKQKCSESFEWLDSGDCEIGSPEMLEWEKRLDRLNEMIDKIDEILDPEEETDDEDW